MRFDCPKCNQKIELPDGKIESMLVCPHCGAEVRHSRNTIYSGRVIAGFELQKLLGVGGMGEVWLAYQQTMEREVAVKILSPYLAEDQEFVDNFLEEVRLVAKLDHPNIITALDAGEEDGVYYLAMQYVPGETCGTRVARDKRLPEEDVLKIALEVGDALKYAWGKFHILHRDVNPSNIMLAPDGKVKLMDMGISKNMSEDDSIDEENLVGTPNYISPEQIQGEEKLDARSDIYSLGATLYHLATGVVPFAGSDTYDTLQKHLSEELPPPHEVNPAVSKHCSVLIETMVAKDRDQRTNSWGILLADIRRVADGKYPETPHPVYGQMIGRGNGGTPAQGASGTSGASSDEGEKLQLQKRVKVSAKDLHTAHRRTVASAQRKKRNTAGPLFLLLVLLGIAGYLAFQLFIEEEKDPLAEKREQASELWESAGKFAETHPEDYPDAIAKYQEISNMASGTVFFARAQEKISELKEEMEKAIEALLERLDREASDLADKGDYRQAAKVYRGYSGVLSERTKEQRVRLAQKYLKQAKNAEERAEQEQLLSKRQLQKILKDIAPDLCAGRLNKVLDKCNSFEKRPITDDVRASLENIKRYIHQVRDINQHLADSFRDEIGEEVEIVIDDSPQSVTIHRVSGNTIHTKVKKSYGLAHRALSIQQLPIQERYERLEGKIDDVSRALFAGIYCCRKGYYANAMKFFQDCGVLSDSLQKQVRKLQSRR